MSSINPSELITLLDFTSLNEADTEESIAAFCQKARLPGPSVAALCVYPRFVKQVATSLKGTGIQLATVVNFPQGQDPLEKVLAEIETSLAHGANEMDLVFPYEAYLAGEKEAALQFVARCKENCPQALLKVILETGAFPNNRLLSEASEAVIQAGADFLKTSTGKRTPGASLETARVLLAAIQKFSSTSKRLIGFKAAGGIREPRQAQAYLELAKELLGPHWPTPRTFRLGASQLFDQLKQG